jgi:glycosyltransferase involved in cell wall biosynthesis
MACKCVPIVFDGGALPEIVGPCGIVVPDGDPARWAEAIKTLWDRCEKLGESARERVVNLYSVGQRVSGLGDGSEYALTSGRTGGISSGLARAKSM